MSECGQAYLNNELSAASHHHVHGSLLYQFRNGKRTKSAFNKLYTVEACVFRMVGPILDVRSRTCSELSDHVPAAVVRLSLPEHDR